jgi:diaminopimelate decarboxylase
LAPWSIMRFSSGAHFVYDKHQLTNQIENLLQIRSLGWVKDIFFSIKSNPNPFLLNFISKKIEGFDISSVAELELIEQLGISSKKCTFSGPSKSHGALRKLGLMGIRCIHLDSYDEWVEIKKIEIEKGIFFKKSIRMKHWSPVAQKVGFSHLELESIKGQSSQERFSGIHFYLGRESFSKENLDRLIIQIEDFFSKFKNLFTPHPELYIGLGLPGGDLHHLFELFQSKKFFFERYPVHIECGRAVIQSCGSYWAQILAIKKRIPRQIIIIDGGLQHVAAKFSSPQRGLEGIDFSLFSQKREAFFKSDRIQLFDISGSLGVWHDSLATEVALPNDVERGDWIVVKGVGAYGWTSATNQFIGPTPIQEWWQIESGELISVSPNKLKSYLEVQIEN